jgi:hypothetical protein
VSRQISLADLFTGDGTHVYSTVIGSIFKSLSLITCIRTCKVARQSVALLAFKSVTAD